MPNWITNRIIADDMDALKKALLDKDGNVDFNKVIPVNEDLSIECGTYTISAIKRYGTDTTEAEKLLKRCYSGRYTQEKFVDTVLFNIDTLHVLYDLLKIKHDEAEDRKNVVNIIKSYYNIRKYGYETWYEANKALWGTKWNAHETYVGNNEIVFETAWSMPFNVFQKLSEITPLTVAYADEDLGANYGIIEFKNGTPTSEYALETDELAANIGMACAIKDEHPNDCLYEQEDEFMEIANTAYKETTEVLQELGFIG